MFTRRLSVQPDGRHVFPRHAAFRQQFLHGSGQQFGISFKCRAEFWQLRRLVHIRSEGDNFFPQIKHILPQRRRVGNRHASNVMDASGAGKLRHHHICRIKRISRHYPNRNHCASGRIFFINSIISANS